MMKQKTSCYLRVLLMALWLPLAYSCEVSDDVQEIFTGKTWKLTFISVKDGKPWEKVDHSIWDNQEEKDASLKFLNQKGTYTLTFDGAVSGDILNGNVNGTGTVGTCTGRFSADGVTRKFNANVTGSDGDKLASFFMSRLNKTIAYEGDSQNLYLIYKMGTQEYMMAFRVEN